MEPDEHGAAGTIRAGRGHVEREAVLARQEPRIAEQSGHQAPVLGRHRPRARGVAHARPGLGRQRRAETRLPRRRPRVGDPAKEEHAFLRVTLDPSVSRLDDHAPRTLRWQLLPGPQPLAAGEIRRVVRTAHVTAPQRLSNALS